MEIHFFGDGKVMEVIVEKDWSPCYLHFQIETSVNGNLKCRVIFAAFQRNLEFGPVLSPHFLGKIWWYVIKQIKETKLTDVASY